MARKHTTKTEHCGRLVRVRHVHVDGNGDDYYGGSGDEDYEEVDFFARGVGWTSYGAAKSSWTAEEQGQVDAWRRRNNARENGRRARNSRRKNGLARVGAAPPFPSWKAGDRVQVKAKHWTGIGKRTGTVKAIDRYRTLVRLDDGTPVDLENRALESIATRNPRAPRKRRSVRRKGR